jgi:hypothetical protein
MRPVLLLSIVGGAVIVLLIFFAVKAAIRAALWKEFEETEPASASAGEVSTSSTGQTSRGANAVQDQKASRETERVGVLPKSGSPSSGTAARNNAGIAAAPPPVASGKTSRETPVQKEMWADSHYVWVVLCKNHWGHLRVNLFYRHRIPLAETDPVDPRPVLNGPFRVRCDSCGKEYLYKPSEVLRFEQELPDNFTPHPLFRDI